MGGARLVVAARPQALIARPQSGLAAASIEPVILVNNAGMISVSDGEMISGDVLSDPSDWTRGLEMNLTSAFLLTRAMMPAMRAAGIPGKVTMEFIVDVTGHVEPGSFKVISTTHQAFVEPTKQLLLKSLFKPGKMRGQAVRVMVHQTINFALS